MLISKEITINHYFIGHMIVSSLVHGVIYSFIWKLMHNLTLPEAAFVVVAVLGCVFAYATITKTRRL